MCVREERMEVGVCVREERMEVGWSGTLTRNMFKVATYFTYFCSVFNVELEQVNVRWNAKLVLKNYFENFVIKYDKNFL